jgi:positive regulator of sigma E activity
MEHIGVVVREHGGRVRVRVAVGDACGDCKARSCCTPRGSTREIDALNAAGALQGQRVRIEISGSRALEAALLLYGLPACLMVIGAVVGLRFGPGWGGLGSVLGLSLGLVVARAAGGRAGRYMSRAVEVVEEGQEQARQARGDSSC